MSSKKQQSAHTAIYHTLVRNGKYRPVRCSLTMIMDMAATPCLSVHAPISCLGSLIPFPKENASKARKF